MTGITLPFSTVRLANQKEGYASSPMTFLVAAVKIFVLPIFVCVYMCRTQQLYR